MDITDRINLTILKESSPKRDWPLATVSTISCANENAPPVKSRRTFAIDHPTVLFLFQFK
jgi:hypothetical protein